MILTEPIRTCLGLDIAKAKLDACLLLGTRALHEQFDNSKPGLRRRRAWGKKHGQPAPFTVLEATGRYSELAAAELHAAGHRVHLANPRRIKDHARSLGLRNKTDRIDAHLIATFGTTRTLCDWQPASPEQEHLRALLRRLADLAGMLQAERNRTEAAADPLVAKSLARTVRALEKESALIEAQIAAHVRATPALRADTARLCALEGIGERSAWWICAETPRHLPDGRAAAAWLGVTPRVRQSGTSLRHTAPAGTEGNRHPFGCAQGRPLRRVLFPSASLRACGMAAMVARRHNPRLKAFADRLAAAGKSKMSVLFAVLHKLFKISFTLLKNQSDCQPTHSAKN